MKTRREFLATTVAAAALLTNGSGQTAPSLSRFPIADDTGRRDTESNDSALGGQDMTDRAEDPRVRRARLAGPEHVTKDATVAEIAADGTMTVLAQGTNEWVCTPGNENKIGAPPHVHEPHGYAMDDGCYARKAEANEHSTRNDLYVVRRHTEKQYQSRG
jgi:hypothetical protein